MDKTLLIKAIIKSGYEVIYITRPRRWGKSLNLNMLKYFFNREVDERGHLINPNPNLVLFKGGKIHNENG